MPDTTLPSDATRSAGPPPRRSPFWSRTVALFVVAAIFWADVIAPAGAAVPVLYVAPTLLFIAAGEYWEPLLAAAGSTVLIVLAAVLSPETANPQLAVVNHALETAMVWISAGLVARYRHTLARWTAQYTEDRRTLDESLQRLEEIRYALDQAAIVATTDQRGIITYVNDKFCEISKYSRQELIGQDHRVINSAHHSKEFIRDLWRTIARGGIWRGEIKNRAKDGTPYWVDTTIVPFLNDAGKPRQYLAIRSDITQRKAAEQQLADQAALAQLGQLAAVVAHEVRNPLAGVKGSLQIFRSKAPADSPERHVIDAMIARLDVLNAKVEDIMRFARPRTPALEPVDARAVIGDAVASARAAIPDCAGVRDPDGTATIMADREMLRAVLLNLILNACQSGTTTPVELHVVADGRICRIRVEDRGSGIPADDSERVFEPFYTTKKTGTGLGLAIVRRLVGLQNGVIDLRPRQGGGTIAELSFGIAPSPR